MAMLVRLSSKFTDEQELVMLAAIGLEMDDYVIERHLNDRPGDLKSAAYNILKEWRMKQKNNQVAYGTIVTALRKVDLENYIAATALTPEMLLRLSKRFTDKSELMTLGIKGFSLNNCQVDACIYKNGNSMTDAAHQLLGDWVKKCDNAEEAYQDLCKVLDNIDMRYYKSVLK